MKHSSILYIALALLPSSAIAQNEVEGARVNSYSIVHDGSMLSVDLDMDLSSLTASRNRAVLLTPRLVNGADSIELPSVAVYGRRRYFHYMRNGQSMLASSNGDDYMRHGKPDRKVYHLLYPYEEWMNGSTLRLSRELYGCCNTLLDGQEAEIGKYRAFEPELIYLLPSPDKSPRYIEGTAYIDFPVNKTAIYPEYHSNAAELARIRAAIDSVRADADITITGVWLKGYASPESPYAHNTELAMGRTEALKTFIQNLYALGDSVISVDYEPENWQGLREYVENSSLEHKEGILALIDSDLSPDAKEAKIKTSYPEEYQYMLANCYPHLRKTDYRVSYVVRPFTDVEEIRRVFTEEPSKLSLNELYTLAQELEPGSEEFTNVFETAARMYPSSAEANLNAANAAIRRGDMETARHYLPRAGESAEADYTRGVAAVTEGDYERAIPLLESAMEKGISKAGYCLDYISTAGSHRSVGEQEREKCSEYEHKTTRKEKK